MSKKQEKRYWVYASPVVRAAFGTSTAALTEALERLARDVLDATLSLEGRISRKEWVFLADLLNGHFPDYNAAQVPFLVSEAEDYIRLELADKRWAVDGEKLIKKLKELSEAEAAAVIRACAWFWQHHESLVVDKNPWWNVQFRVEFAKKAEK